MATQNPVELLAGLWNQFQTKWIQHLDLSTMFRCVGCFGLLISTGICIIKYSNRLGKYIEWWL